MKIKLQWTEPQWRAFGLRCQNLRNQVGIVADGIQGVKGLTAPLVDALHQVGQRFISAMIAMENRFEAECPTVDWWKMLHGVSGTGFPSSNLPPRKLSVLTCEEWIRLGVEVKGIRDELSAIVIAASPIFGVSHQAVKRIESANRALSRGRSKLDNLCRAQHPDWPDAERVFYGPNQSPIDLFRGINNQSFSV